MLTSPDWPPQFVNAALDFDGAGATDATQTFELPVTNDLVELPVRSVFSVQTVASLLVKLLE